LYLDSISKYGDRSGRGWDTKMDLTRVHLLSFFDAMVVVFVGISFGFSKDALFE
jgi:hypothetical protein